MKIVGGTSELEIDLRDATGATRSRLDFKKIISDRTMALEMKRAFWQAMSHLSLETQRQSFRCCRKFGQFLHTNDLLKAKPLPVTVVLMFREWLGSQQLNPSTQQSILNVVVTILKEMECGGATVLPKNLRFDVAGFRRTPAAIERRLLADSDLKTIWAAAVRETEGCAERIAAGRRLLADPESETGTLLRDLMSIGDGRLPLQKVVNRSRQSLARRVQDYGGLKKLSAQIFPNTRDCCAALICMLIQTGGNPYAVYGLSTDCIKPHALRSDVEWLVWTKERSRSEQKVDSLKYKIFSPTNIARLWLDISSSLRLIAMQKDRTKLFLAMTPHGPRQPCFQSMHLVLDKFIKENELPVFDFKDIRSAEANIIFQETHDIREVRIRLNHRQLRTTTRYLETRVVSEQNSALINRFQGLLVRMAETGSKETELNQVRVSPSGRAFRTVFGFDCKDPFAGIAEGSRPDELCSSFQMCATCPGAIVPLDDVSVIARLVQTRRALMETQRDAAAGGWLPRFNQVYGPTLRVIEDDLLPHVTEAVLAAATKCFVPALPRLE